MSFEKNLYVKRIKCTSREKKYSFLNVFCDHLDLTLRRKRDFLILQCHFRFRNKEVVLMDRIMFGIFINEQFVFSFLLI